jgi:hypothetical protein
MSRALPNWIDSYLAFTEEQESPEAFHFWMALVVLSASLRRRVWLDRGWDDYLLYPNIYVLFVAESATTRKSQAIDMGLSILREAVPDIYTIGDSATPEGIIKHVNRVTHSKGSNGQVRVSTESSLLIHADELASLFSFDKQRASRMGILLTRVYRSPKKYEHTTSGEGKVEIFNPYFTLIAATAPQNLKVIPPDSTGGLMGRLIFVAEKSRRATIAWGPKLRQMKRSSSEISELRRLLIADLYRIAHLEGEIHPTAEAVDVFEQWYNAQADKKYSSPSLDAFHARSHDTALQLATLLCVSDSDDLVMRPSHVLGGIKFMEKQLPEAARLQEWAGASDFAQNRAKVLDILRRAGGWATRRAIIREVELSSSDLDSLLLSMCEADMIAQRKTGDKNIVYRLVDGL